MAGCTFSIKGVDRKFNTESERRAFWASLTDEEREALRPKNPFVESKKPLLDVIVKQVNDGTISLKDAAKRITDAPKGTEQDKKAAVNYITQKVNADKKEIKQSEQPKESKAAEGSKVSDKDKEGTAAEKELNNLAFGLDKEGRVQSYLEGKEPKKGTYDSGVTMKEQYGEAPTNPQEIELMDLRDELQNGISFIDKAKEIYGDNYVQEVLDFVNKKDRDTDLPIHKKTMILVSLENDLASQKINNPNEAARIEKLQILVNTDSQALLRDAALAINMGRLRSFARTGFDINKMTESFFTTHQKKDRSEIEKAVQANGEEINKAADDLEAQKAAEAQDIEDKIKAGVQAELEKVYQKLPSEKKKVADKAISALTKFQAKLRAKSYSDATGMIALMDAGVTTIIATIKAGKKITTAIEKGINQIKAEYEKQFGKEWDGEKEFRQDITDELRSSGAFEKEDKMRNKREYRMLETERNRQLAKVAALKDKLARLESGELDESDIKEILKDTPEIEALKEQIRVAESELRAKEAKEKAVEANIEKLKAELQRVTDRKKKEPSQNTPTAKQLTTDEQDLVNQIKVENDKWQKEKDNAAQAKKEYRALETERNRQIERVTQLQDRLAMLQSGQKPNAKTPVIKIDTPEIEALKKQVTDESANLTKLENQKARIIDLETKLEDLKQRKATAVLPSQKRDVSEEEQKLKDEIKAERQIIRDEIRDSKMFDDKNEPETTQSDRLEAAKERLRQKIEDTRKEIARHKRKKVKKADKVQADQELKRLEDDLTSLESLRDKYLPKEADPYKFQKTTDAKKTQLTKEIMELNRQIQKGQKDRFDNKESKENTALDSLRDEKAIRQSILEAIDPTPKMFVENALLQVTGNNGKLRFGREITVTVNQKDSNGNDVLDANGKKIKVQEKRTVLDWTKLAGKEGSVDSIRKHVEEALRNSGFTEEQMLRIQDSFIEEYNNLRASVIEKAQTAIAAKNKVVVTSEQRSAATKLAEMYNYGLFDKNLTEYEVALAKVIGIDTLSVDRVKAVVVLSKSLNSLYASSFQGNKLTESQLKTAIQDIEEQMKGILNDEALHQQMNIKGAGFFKFATMLKAYMSMAQRMILVSFKAMVENPISGLEEFIFNKIGYGAGLPKGFAKQRREAAISVLKNMVLQKGYDYGNISSSFTTKSNLDTWLNKASDNEIINAALSTVTGKTFLDAVDSSFKAAITQMKFTSTVIKMLTKDRIIETYENGVKSTRIEKGMTKQEAKNYAAERLLGQSFAEAQMAAVKAIEEANKEAGRKVFNDTPSYVNRLANDIVTASLVNGGKMSEDMVVSAYKASYRAAGRGLGHVANNWLSTGISRMSGQIEKEINDAIKEKKFDKAAWKTLESILFTNVLNPFAGGGFNWVRLKLEKTGVGVLVGAISMREHVSKAGDIDLTTEEGIKESWELLYNEMKARDMIIRGVVGAMTTALGAALFEGVVGEDEWRKWRKANKTISKYADLVTPEALLAYMAFDSETNKKRELTNYFLQLFNKNSQNDKMLNLIDATISGALDDGSAAGKFGKVAGSVVNSPFPWRPFRDAQQLASDEPYKVSGKKIDGDDIVEDFLEGFFRGGMFDFLRTVLKGED